jgi:GTP cyclohydrolase I
MEELYRQLLESIGETPSRPGLVETPRRALQALRDMTRGYDQDPKELIKEATFTEGAEDMVVLKNIEVYSLCEHHLLPFFGKCHVGYIPRDGKILGLSKIARIADLYARRLQVQERLTRQIAELLMEATNAHGVGVVMEMRHLCMMMRGVEKQESVMVTSATLGNFRENAMTRNEFLKIVR